MKLTTSSCILILGMMFHSMDAARKIFTINNNPPSSDGAFGDVFISQQERDQMIQLNGKGNSIFKTFTLQTPLNYFDNRERPSSQLNKIFIHYNGLISLDPTSAVTIATAQDQIRAYRASLNFMAIFWQQYISGNVHSFSHSKNGAQTLSQESLEIIATDLSKAFSQAAKEDLSQRTPDNAELKARNSMTADQIQDVYVFTWVGMEHETIPKNGLKSTFQALLIRVNNGQDGDQWFLKTFLALLNTNEIPNQGSGEMTKVAQIGIGIANPEIVPQRIDFHNTMGLALPNIYELLSNEYDFKDQSSYSFDLNADAKRQPLPTIDCSNNNCRTTAGQGPII